MQRNFQVHLYANYIFYLILLTFICGDASAVTNFSTSVISLCPAAATLFFVAVADALVAAGFLPPFFFWSGGGTTV